MIDEFTRAEEEFRQGRIDNAFFSGLQWLAGTQHISFFICVHDHIYRQGTQSWGFLQRGHPIYLPTLDKQATTKLIKLPLQSLYQFEPGVIEDILDLTNGHPYFTQAICLELSGHMSKQESTLITQDHLRIAVHAVLRIGSHYFNHFYAHLNDTTLAVLKCLASLSGMDNRWVERDDIQEAVLALNIGNRLNISESIGTLYQYGIIETHVVNNKVAYRIPIRLFQTWIQIYTSNVLVSQDIRRH